MSSRCSQCGNRVESPEGYSTRCSLCKEEFSCKGFELYIKDGDSNVSIDYERICPVCMGRVFQELANIEAVTGSCRDI